MYVCTRQGLLHSRPTSLHDMKAIVKTWRNRLPVVADPLSHWGAIFTWRQHHYQFIASHYDSQTEHGSNHSMLGVHASAQVPTVLARPRTYIAELSPAPDMSSLLTSRASSRPPSVR